MMKRPLVGATATKRAETTSSVGAGVLGAGVGLLAGRWLQPFAIPIVIVGLAMHAWGMYDKHRLEARVSAPRIWWVELLYWGCWIGLASLLAYVVTTVR